MDTTPYTIINNAHEYMVEGLNRETRYYVYLKSSCDTTWLEDSVITRGLAGEESVIVAEGTTHNRYLPIYGNYFDEPIACQSVYPASLLTSLTGKSITRLHYFVYSGNGTAWTDTKPMTVKIKVVGDTLLSAYNTLENAVTVFNGVCVGSTVNSTNGFDIVFDTVTSHIITGLTPDHNYNVYLRTLCNGSDHNEGSSNWATTVFRTFPNVRVPEIQWARVNGKHSAKVKVLNTGLDLGQPTHYDYIVSSILLDATVLDSITPTASGIDTSCFEISGLQSSTRYFLYFRNVFGGEVSPWSTPDSITMPPEMPAVINLGVINIAHNALTATWQSDTANYADETAWRTAIAPHDSIPATSEWVTITEALTAHAGMHPFIGLYTDSAYDIYVCAFNPVTGATSDTVVLNSVRTTVLQHHRSIRLHHGYRNRHPRKQCIRRYPDFPHRYRQRRFYLHRLEQWRNK